MSWALLSDLATAVNTICERAENFVSQSEWCAPSSWGWYKSPISENSSRSSETLLPLKNLSRLSELFFPVKHRWGSFATKSLTSSSLSSLRRVGKLFPHRPRTISGRSKNDFQSMKKIFHKDTRCGEKWENHRESSDMFVFWMRYAETVTFVRADVGVHFSRHRPPESAARNSLEITLVLRGSDPSSKTTATSHKMMLCMIRVSQEVYS